jgi:hypothetical protein
VQRGSLPAVAPADNEGQTVFIRILDGFPYSSMMPPLGEDAHITTDNPNPPLEYALAEARTYKALGSLQASSVPWFYGAVEASAIFTVESFSPLTFISIALSSKKTADEPSTALSPNISRLSSGWCSGTYSLRRRQEANWQNRIVTWL